MLSHVQLRDFKPDVVICPHCTQHLMGVKDVQWASDRVCFTYSCAGCGHEIDRPVGEDLISAARAAVTGEARKPVRDDVTEMGDFPFPFRKPREPGPLFTFEAADDATTDDYAAADSLPQDDVLADGLSAYGVLEHDAPADDESDDEDLAEESYEPAPFGSMSLLPPKPSWLETPLVSRERPALTPKQMFDVERRDSERFEGPLPDPVPTTRASVLLRDVSIFNL